METEVQDSSSVSTQYSIPQNTIDINCRDANGFRKGIQYKFKADGTVDYRAMVKPEHLYFNPDKAAQIAKKYGVEQSRVASLRISDNPNDTLENGYVQLSTVEDSHVLMRLAGSLYLAWLRGYQTVKARLVTASYDFAAVETEIVWIANYESGFQFLSYTNGADAHPYNTSPFGRNFLTCIAFNRAFVRAVRFFLGIEIVSSEEVGPNSANNPPVQQPATQTTNLIKDQRELCREKINSLGFEKFSDFLNVLVKKYVKNPDSTQNEVFEKDPESWTSVDDMTTNDIHTVLSILSRKKKATKA